MSAPVTTRPAVVPAVRPQPSLWSIWPTLGASWIAFAHAVSFQGLAIWVLGGCVLTALTVALFVRAHRRILSLLAMVVMTFAVPAIAEWIGGNTAGPVTRASLMACAVTGAMVVILGTRYPLAILVPSLVLLGGALGLGAAGSALWLVGVWCVAAAVTVAILGPFTNLDLRSRRRLLPFAIMLGAAGAIGVVALIPAALLLGTPWTMPGATTVAAIDVVPPPVTTPPPVTDTTTPPPITVPVEEQNLVVSLIVIVALALLLLLLLLLLIQLLRRAVVALLWVRERQRLQRGDREERVIGAWTWVRLRRARYDQPLPLYASPDVAVRWAQDAGDVDVRRVAQLAARVAFNPGAEAMRADAKEAWLCARVAGRRPYGASLRQRWRWSARTPRSVRSSVG